jgi:hypothetical protein
LPAFFENLSHSNVILTAGGGAFGHKDGPKPGATSCRQGEEAWLLWKAGTYGDVSLSDGLIEFAKTHEELKGAFLTFQKDADQIYPGWKEKLGYTGESSVQAASFDWQKKAAAAPFIGLTARLEQGRGQVSLKARGGGEYDVSDADIQNFYNSLLGGGGGDPPKGTVLSELVVKFFHGEFTPQGFKRYSGLWKGPPPGGIGKKDIAVGVAGLKQQMANPMFVTKGGVGYGVDETQKVANDNKGWVWLAAEMSPGGLALELFQSVPYGKRALLVAKQSNVDELFSQVNWDVALANVEKTLGGPQIKQR